MSGRTLEASEGTYKIYSEKKDECPPESGWLIQAIALIGIATFIPLTVFLKIIESPFQPFSVLVAFLCFILFFIPTFFCGCGVKVSLTDGFGKHIRGTSYKFSNDKERDAAKIKELIAWYVIRAKQLVEADHAEGERCLKEIEKREQCDSRYESIVEMARKL